MSLRDHFEVEIIQTERDHVFTCGTEGTVANEIVIKVKMAEKFNLQTHTAFYDELKEVVANQLEGEIEGYLDNCE